MCQACYGAKHLTACGDPACGELVDAGVQALGKAWHEKCFKCAACHAPLKDQPFREKGGAPYCEACYVHRFAPKCHACGKGCREVVTTAALPGRSWHPDCFVCASCHGRLDGEFYAKEEQMYCGPCHELKFLPRCRKCSKPITGSVITALAAKWHAVCFTCCLCHTAIGTERFHQLPTSAPPHASAAAAAAAASAASAAAGCGAALAPDKMAVCVSCYEVRCCAYACIMCVMWMCMP